MIILSCLVSFCSQSMNKLLPSKLTINTDLHPRVRGPRCSKRLPDTPRGPDTPKTPKEAPTGPAPRSPRSPWRLQEAQEAPGASEAPRGPHQAPGGLVLFGFLSVKNSSGVDTIKLQSHFFAVLFLVLVCTSVCFVCFSVVFLSDAFPSL